jgi:regulation of enolase protein 1 (concanavalin A-like superfamily)
MHDLNADNDVFNAPRVIREANGDFSATVKVVGDFKPGEKSTNPKSYPYNGAGIFVWQNSDNYIFLGRAAILRNKRVNTFAAFEEREWGARAALNNNRLDPGTAYLRLERRGNRLFGSTSRDGKTWAKLESMDISYPGTIKLGLYAINTGNEAMSVRFEDFKFTETKSRPTPGKPSAKPTSGNRRNQVMTGAKPPLIVN